MFNAYATIDSIDSFVDSKIFDTFDSDTLVVLDIDDTLISSEDIFDHGECYKTFIDLVIQGRSKLATPQEKEAYQNTISLIFLEPKRNLIETQIPLYIEALKKKGVKVVALTSCLNGKFGLLNKVEDWRHDQLQNLGLNFADTFSFPSFFLQGFDQKNHNPPLFDRGILYCYGYSKGDALKAFLEAISLEPRRIFFADDILSNVEDVHNKLAPIEVTGCHFTGARLSADRINLDLIRFQYEYLIQNNKWLPDVEALKLLNKEPL